MPKPSDITTVRLDPEQLAQLAKLIGQEIAAALGTAPAVVKRNGMLTPEEAAAYISKPVGTLKNWRWAGRGPKFIKVGRAIRYRIEALEKYLSANTRQTTDPLR